MKLSAGTSGFAFKEWKGPFYPPKLPASGMLSYYAERLPTVEINYTFYRMPNAKTIAGWSEATPPQFTFVLKAPQRITHQKKLAGAEDEVRHLFDVATSLGDTSKLDPKIRARTEEANLRRLIREKFGLPRLTLFG